MGTDKVIIAAMLNGYYELYGKEDFKTWQVLRSEPMFDLPDFMNSGFNFLGRMDLTIRIKSGKHKGVWCLENKSRGRIDNYRLEHVKIDPQLLGYLSASRQMLGELPRGVIWNVVRKPSIRQKKNQTLQQYRNELKQDYIDRPSFYYYRDFLPVPPKAVDNWESEVTNTLLDFELACEHPEDPDIWYKNPSMCYAFDRCPYLPLCTRGENARTLALFRAREDDKPAKGKKDGKGKETKKKSRQRVVRARRARQAGKH